MDMAPFSLLVLDASGRLLLLVDGLSGEAYANMAYPSNYTPTGLAVTGDFSKAFIPAVSKDNCGAIFAANLKSRSIYRLPVDLPHPMQFALAPDSVTAYFSAPGGILYKFCTTTLELAPCGQAGNEQCCCVGLAAAQDKLYSAWELEGAGVLAVFDHSGRLCDEHRLQGIPTNIVYDKRGIIMVPFTSDGSFGEGLYILREQKDGQPTVLKIQCPACAYSNRAYPCQAIIAPDGQTVYIVNEDSGTISIADITNAKVVDCFSVGRSISTLQLLPDSRFAIASSNMFGDLALLDLVNGRLLSFTNDNREYLSCVVVLPSQD